MPIPTVRPEWTTNLEEKPFYEKGMSKGCIVLILLLTCMLGLYFGVLAPFLREQDVNKYLSCMTSAYSAYKSRWDDTCIKLGEKKDCLLDTGLANSYADDRIQQEALCDKIYKI